MSAILLTSLNTNSKERTSRKYRDSGKTQRMHHSFSPLSTWIPLAQLFQMAVGGTRFLSMREVSSSGDWGIPRKRLGKGFPALGFMRSQWKRNYRGDQKGLGLQKSVDLWGFTGDIGFLCVCAYMCVPGWTWSSWSSREKAELKRWTIFVILLSMRKPGRIFPAACLLAYLQPTKVDGDSTSIPSESLCTGLLSHPKRVLGENPREIMTHLR